MVKNDDSLARAGDILEALQLLSRLPLPPFDDHRGAAAAWAYPLAGLVIGTLAASVGLFAHWLGLPATLSALLILAAMIMITGALHEDGLADTADGLWGGWTIERRLEIMKDSRIGSYGVIALCLGLAARWAALWIVFAHAPQTAVAAVLVAATGSRAMMPAVMALVPHARQDGLSAHVGAVRKPAAMLGGAVAVAVAIIFSGLGGVIALACGVGTTAALSKIAKAKIGGQTGDILGATQQLSEIAILFTLVALL